MAEQSVFLSSLLGPIREPAVTVAIDTSASMYSQLDVVRHGVSRWLETCSRAPFSKPRINLVALGAQSSRWRDTVAQLTPSNLGSALSWLASLRCSGGECDLMDGLRLSLSDVSSRAVYFLTDGFPSTDESSSVQVLSELFKWNHSAQPIHIVVIGSGKDALGDSTAVRSSRQPFTVAGHPVTAAATTAADLAAKSVNARLLSSLAQQTLGSLRHVGMPAAAASPSHQQQVQVPHATVVADYHPGNATATGKLQHPHQSKPDFKTSIVSWTSPAAPLPSAGTPPHSPASHAPEDVLANSFQLVNSTLCLPGASLHPTESLLGRFVIADYMQGMLVLALCYDEGIYRPGTVAEQVDGEQFLIEFSRDERGSPDVRAPYQRQQKTHLSDFLALLDALDQPFDVTDRVLALRRDDVDGDVYIPATVMKVAGATAGGMHEAKVLVAFHDGQLEPLHHHQVVKISASRYLKAVQAVTSTPNEWTSCVYSPLFEASAVRTPRGASALRSPRGVTGNHGGLDSPCARSHRDGKFQMNSRALAASSGVSANEHESQAALRDNLSPGPIRSLSPTEGREKSFDLGSESGNGPISNGDWLNPEDLAPADEARAPKSDTEDGGRWWPCERRASGRVLNVSPEFQDGFEAGFAAAQRTMTGVQRQKDSRQPSPDDMLKSYRRYLKSKRSKAEYRQGRQWQHSTRKGRTSNGRNTILQVPREAIVQLSLQDRPWTATSRLDDDSRGLRKQGSLHVTSQEHGELWLKDTQRIHERTVREVRRQCLLAAKKEKEDRVKEEHLLATQKRITERLEQLEITAADKERRSSRHGKSPVKLPDQCSDQEAKRRQNLQLLARQARQGERQQRAGEAEDESQLRKECRQATRSTRAADRSASHQHHVSALAQATERRLAQQQGQARARQEKQLAQRLKDDQKLGLEEELDSRKEQDWRNRNFS